VYVSVIGTDCGLDPSMLHNFSLIAGAKKADFVPYLAEVPGLLNV